MKYILDKILRIFLIPLISIFLGTNIAVYFFEFPWEGVLWVPIAILLWVTIRYIYNKWLKHLEVQKELEEEQKTREREEKLRKEIKDSKEKKKQERKKQKKKEIDDLSERFGSKYSEDIYKAVYKKGMTKDMIKEIDRRKDTDPAYKFEEDELEEWYYTSSLMPYLGFTFKISFKDNKVTDIPELEDGIWIDMTKEVLIKACGQPADIKKNVSRDFIKEKWYYGERETRQGTVVYKREVRLENGVVSGWAELE